MKERDNETIASEFIRVWTVGNLDILDRLADREIDVTYTHFPEPIKGRSAFRSVLEHAFHDFPDLRTMPKTIIVEGNRAVVEWVYEGTHQNGELFGVEPEGVRVRVPGVTLYRIHEGHVVEGHGIADVLALMSQLGALDGS